jgi:hypothetical protein
MNTMDINELERQLVGGPSEQDRPDLTTIRRLGQRRRRTRSAMVGGVAALVLAGSVGGGAVLLGSDGSAARDATVAAASPAAKLSPLAARALTEIPGARQVNSGQVVIPAPDDKLFMAERVEVEGEPAELPRHYYYGVTSYRPSAWPSWLYEGTEAAEQAAADDDGSYGVGTTDVTGVLVDAGERYLACALPRKDWGRDPDAPCFPAIVTEHSAGGYVYEYGLGTDDFLTPGAPMEVFVDESYLSGDLATLAVAGIDGADVARAEFVAVDGTRVEGTVEAGTLVEGESLFFAEVPGELARVIAYDAAGEVIEDHELRECDTPVECEVR